MVGARTSPQPPAPDGAIVRDVAARSDVAADGAARSDVAADGATILYESDRTRVHRVPLADGSGHVIRKEYLGPAAGRRRRGERRLLERLAGVPGIAQLVDAPEQSGVLVLTDVGGAPLSEVPAGVPLAVADVVRVASDLAEVLARVHGRGVVHRDVSPGNIVLSARGGRAYLVDFDLGSTFGAELPAFAHHGEIAGTLAYMAPEQTGRTGQSADHRADLYGLGAVLYELTTGRPPFAEVEALGLLHAALATRPVPPADRNPAVPALLSRIIMRLLEKDPARRYQSAAGVAYDLGLVGAAPDGGADLELGRRDFPLRLAPPSRPVGRDAEIELLGHAFTGMLAGRGRTFLVTGGPGVGKTALLQQLRPDTARAGGWFVAGRFDEHVRAHDLDGLRQALRGLVRMVLVEPEETVAAIRTRLRAELAGNAGLAVALSPELGAVLEQEPEAVAADLSTLLARLQQIGVGILRAVASPDRPVVLALDDLHWATPTALAVMDAIHMADDLSGVLLLGAFRTCDVGVDHPLAGLIARWGRLGVTPTRLELADLPQAALGMMLGEMLRLSPEEATSLAAAVGELTRGNPADTVELLNALRHDGLLTLGEHGWRWDAAAIGRYIGEGSMGDLLTARLDGLPQDASEIVDLMACLGGELTVERLAVAAGLDPDEVEPRLGAALANGVLGMDWSAGVLAFPRDVIHRAVSARLTPERRSAICLAAARRLAADPRYEVHAAEPYLDALAQVVDPVEASRVAAVLQAAAAQARGIADFTEMERYASAALDVARRCGPAQADGWQDALIARLAIDRHAALCALGRLAEADDVHREIRELTDDPLVFAEPTGIQIASLTAQNRPMEALALATDLLGRLGVPPPEDPDELRAQGATGLAELRRWAASGDETDDLARPEDDDPSVLAIATTLDRAMPAAFFTGHPLFAWMVVEAGRLWAEHGPSAALCGPLGHASFATVTVADDYEQGVRIARRVVAVGEARGYEPNVSRARFTYSASASPWREPIETTVLHSHRAHEGLVRHGEVYFAGGAFYSSVPHVFDCAPTLDEASEESDRAVAFCERTGNAQAGEAYVAYRQLTRALRGLTAPGTFDEPGFDEAEYVATTQVNLVAMAYYAIAKGMQAVVADDLDALVGHAEAVVPALPAISATYPGAQARVLSALALAHRLRSAPDDDREALLAELDTHRDWLSARAEQAPENFRHLQHLVDAERAWATGDFLLAARSFDAAQNEVAGRRRPWHRAVILERAARCYLAHGLGQVGHRLLADARSAYADWGATVKVADLDRSWPQLRSAEPGARRGGSTQRSSQGRTETLGHSEIDLVGIIKAAQSFGSQSDLDQLQASVTTILTALSGATSVRMALWSDETREWIVPSPTADGAALAADGADWALLPLSALRYVERTREPLVVDDATQDDRFARDPYFDGVGRCSLLAMPVLARGLLKAILVLEHRAARAAFSADRLDGIALIAGQLAVSLDSAMLTASLERRVAERTRALGEANERLSEMSGTDPLTGVANRRRLAEVSDARWRGAQAAGGSLGVAMIDVDFFKEYNDRYGHLAGDRCLAQVAQAIGRCIRGGDLLARYGGDEFLVLLPDATDAAARAVAVRIRDAVRSLGLTHVDSPHRRVTVSIGVAVMSPVDGDRPEQLIEAADAGLYRAKKSGRDRVDAEL